MILMSLKNKTIHKIIMEDSGGIDILINNAGFFTKSPLEEIDIELTKKVFNINVFAPILLTKLFSQNMKIKKWGKFLMLDLHLRTMEVNLLPYIALQSMRY